MSPAAAERDAQLSLYRRLEDAFDQALKSNVNIYAIEAGGLGGTANFLESRGFSSIDPRQTSAMSGFLPAGDIPMRVTAAAFAIPGKRESALAIVAALRQPAPDRRETQTIELLTRAFDPQGRARGSSRQTARVVLRPAGGDEAQFEVLSRIELKPGRYSLRVAGNNTSSGKSGSVYLDVDVPDFGRQALALSGVVVSTSHPPQSAPRDALTALVPVVPTSLREFRHDDAISAFARVYVDGKQPIAPVAVDARVLDATGRRVYGRSSTIGPSQFDPSRAADCRIDLPVSRFAAGSYLLTIEAKAAGRVVARHVRFAVRP